MNKSTLLAGVCFSLFAAPVFAQSAPNTVPAAKDVGLADIIVTATKREQNLQNVPVAVTAISGQALSDQHITEFADLTRAAASLTITQAPASPNDSIILRGIGTFAFSIGVEPSVAVIVDDVPVVQQAQAFDNLNDVQRIEVLRGPQGTLFGKNASAGAINIVTNDPSKTLKFTAEALATTDSQFGGNVSISGPVDSTAGAILSAYYSHFDGYINNLADGHKLGDEKKYGVRGKLKVEFSPRLTATLAGNYSELDQNGTAGAYGTIRYINFNYVPPGKPAGTPPVTPNYNGVSIAPALVGQTLGDGNYNVSIDNDSPTSNQQTTVSGKLNYDLGFANLISITSYQDWKYNFSADFDMTALNVNGAAAPVTNPGGSPIGVNQSGPYHATEFTQELRLTSKGNGRPLSYVLGGFYSNAATNRYFARGPALVLANWDGYQGTRSIAAFGGVDYKLPTKTTLSGAIRVNNERVQDNFDDLLPSHNATPAAIIANCGTGAPNCAGRNVDTAVTFKAAVTQEIVPRVNIYASVATGYKGYAYDISSGYNPLRTANPVLPEHSTSYEIGVKSRFLDNKVQLNLTGFLTDYNNFQAQSSQLIGGVLQQKLNNVGKLRTKGFETELLAKATSWLMLNASAAYTEATIVSFRDAACYPGQLQDQQVAAGNTTVGAEGINTCGATSTPGITGNFQDRSGGQLPNSPKFKANIGATVEQKLSPTTKGSFGLNYQYQSGVNFDLLGDPLLTQSAYSILNANAGLEHGLFKLSLFVNNIFNKHYATSESDQFGTYGTHAVFQFQPRDSQRYAGIKIGAKF